MYFLHSITRKFSNQTWILGLTGGIANGRFLPADEHQQTLAIKQKLDPNFKSKYPYQRRQMQFQCLPLTSIIKALGNFLSVIMI